MIDLLWSLGALAFVAGVGLFIWACGEVLANMICGPDD